jgi:uncharacterized repeat protein (TIGR02543 family)
MMLTGSTATSFNVNRLITDWQYNLESGVRVLRQKFELALSVDPSFLQTLQLDNWYVLENWRYGLAYYNGWKNPENPYVATVLGHVASPPSRISVLFPAVSVASPASVISGFQYGKGYAVEPIGRWTYYNGATYAGPAHVGVGYGGTTEHTLTIHSSNPSTGVLILVSPNDVNGDGNATTPFPRYYNENDYVSLVASSTAPNGNSFQKWQKDGGDVTTNTYTTIQMDNDHTLTAVYASTVQPPSKPTNPSPSNGATNQSINTNISWANGGGADSYVVYFGTDSTPDESENRGEQTGTTYDPPETLAYNTKYYWRIKAVNSADTTLGDVWNFTTEAAPGPSVAIVTDKSSVSVPEGSTTTFRVKLSAQPTSSVTVSVTRSSGDSDISVQSGSSLTFTTSTWSTYQTVTLYAANDADTSNGSATIRCSASGLTSVDVTATEADNDAGDTEGPTVYITSPLAGTYLYYITSASTIMITGTATDNVGVMEVRWSANQVNGVATGTNDWVINQAIPEGYTDFAIYARDYAENLGSFAYFRVTRTNITTDKTSLSVPEEGTASFQVKLSHSTLNPPVTVVVERVSGDSDIQVQSGASLVFDNGDGGTYPYQTVVLSAANDSDSLNGQATIRCRAVGWPSIASKDIVVTEQDNDAISVPELSVSPNSRPVDSNAGSTGFTVQNTGSGTLNWSVSEPCSWVSTSGGDRSLTAGQSTTLTVNYDQNSNTPSRSCTLAFTSSGAIGSPKNVTLNQSGTGLPDLINSWVSWQGEAVEGNAFWIEEEIKNVGDGAAQASHAKLYLSTDNDWDVSDDYYVSEKSVPALAAGEYARIRWDFTMPDLGSAPYEIWAVCVVDCRNEVVEASEANTYKTQTSHTVTGTLQSRYTLNTSINPDGAGYITLNPSPGGDGKYEAGAAVQLTSHANSGYTFVSWSGDATGSSNFPPVVMNGNKSVTANFKSTGHDSAVKVLRSTMHEEVLPADLIGSPSTKIKGFQPIAIRVIEDIGIDPKSAWYMVEGDRGYVADGGTWLASSEFSSQDGWIVFSPTRPYVAGEILTISAGANRVDGTPIEPLTYTFEVCTCPETAPEPPFIAETEVDSPLNTSLGTAVTASYRIGPSGVFDEPVTVQIPVPEGMDPGELVLFYFSESDRHRGWFPAERVTGFLVPDSRRAVAIGGIDYVEVQVQHSGVLVLAKPSEVNLAGLGSVDIAAGGSSRSWVTLLSLLSLFALLFGSLALRKRRSGTATKRERWPGA